MKLILVHNYKLLIYFRYLNFRGWLLGNHIYVKKVPYLVCYLDIWLLGTFVNSSCDIKINVNIVQNCCRNLAVRGLKSSGYDKLELKHQNLVFSSF